MTDEPIKCKFWLLPSNRERLWTVSALQGENQNETINRAIEFYEAVHRLDPPEDRGRFLVRRHLRTMSWTDGDGVLRRIARLE